MKPRHSRAYEFRQQFTTLFSSPEDKRLNKFYEFEINRSNLRLERVKSPSKQLEQRYITKGRRVIFNYEENLTSSLLLGYEVEETKSEDSEDSLISEIDPFEYLECIKDKILEHAEKRVDLFFYMLCAYYNQNANPVLGKTRLQHGKGSSKNNSPTTHACHSSFFPSIVDDSIFKSEKVKESEEDLFYKISLVTNTHFMDSLNSTVELPAFINEIDCMLEETFGCRKKAEKILQKVSEGRFNPVDGLKLFFLMMQNTYEKMLKSEKFLQPIKGTGFDLSPEQLIELKIKALKYMRYGTFKHKWLKTSTELNNEYIYMMLRLSPKQIKKCMKNTKTNFPKILQDKVIEIQKEILETPSAHAVKKSQNV